MVYEKNLLNTPHGVWLTAASLVVKDGRLVWRGHEGVIDLQLEKTGFASHSFCCHLFFLFNPLICCNEQISQMIRLTDRASTMISRVEGCVDPVCLLGATVQMILYTVKCQQTKKFIQPNAKAPVEIWKASNIYTDRCCLPQKIFGSYTP
ncbi:hypothetical protein CHARACLAT_004681 [Characodon lateralis]|uniref:Uncharacterized protein n=1 Tax=Characodon lateralis TaxID=208331 RepID=A0ABU7DNT6_9TELE|nr:hypothetical protein [Characodon lateralis]